MTYSYQAIWHHTNNPHGEWQVWVWDAATNAVMHCADRTDPDAYLESSCHMPGDFTQEDIEAELVTWIAERGVELAEMPKRIHGHVTV